MGKSAFVLGGTGQIGRAVCSRLTEEGWDVVAGARESSPPPPELSERGIRVTRVDRAVPGELTRAVGPGADVLVDIVAFTADDAREVVALAPVLDSVVAISSAAVYADDAWRSLDTQEEAPPEFPVPIGERQRTVAPGNTTYATRKVAMELVLRESRLRATIIRAGAVQGPGARVPRELFFVKRILDGRRFVPLAYRGESRFHTTSIENLAELVWLAAERPGKRIVNCGDPEPPTALGIARAVAAAMNHDWSEILLPGPPHGSVGDTPWTTARPFVLDMLDAELELRYRPVTTYERSVAMLCRWLADTLRRREWTEAFPDAVEYMRASFDYEAEDAFISRLRAEGRIGSG